MIFHENRLLADDSLVISYFIFSKLGKMLQNLSSAAVVIGALRVKPEASTIMRALSGARCTDARLYTLGIKIGTNQRALGEHSHC